jgi:hypothetical protein
MWPISQGILFEGWVRLILVSYEFHVIGFVFHVIISENKMIALWFYTYGKAYYLIIPM